MRKTNRIVLNLCSRKSACPVAQISNRVVIIKDDFGGEIHLTRKEFDILVKEGIKLKS
jgi:hypothetical protein